MSTSAKRSHEEMEELAAMANGKTRQQDVVVKAHPSGYTWTRAEDEPGYSWNNKKAIDEHNRAADVMVHRDRTLKTAFGDIIEIVEKEKAILASLKER